MNTPRKNQTAFLLLGIVMVLALAALSCNLPAGLQERFFGSPDSLTPSPAPTNTPQPLPPAIVETDPPAGSNLPVQGPVTIYFNQDMDQPSVENALSGDPALDGTFTWQNPSTLVYQPRTPLPFNTRLVLSLSTTAAAANGLALPEALEVVFFTPDWLRASSLLPLPDSIEVDPSSAVVAAFNQPVTDLSQQGEDPLPAFSLSPAAPGKGEWINTSTYIFTPQGGLQGGISYRVDLSPDLVSTAGTSLPPDSQNSWTFTTGYPQVLAWEPYDGETGVPLDASLALTFNQALNPDSLAENFRLVDGSGADVTGEMEWSEDFREMIFTPDQLLQRSTSYSALLPGEVVSAGNTPLMTDTTWKFQTTGEFAFLGTPGGQNYTPTIYEGATLYFNNPVDKTTIEDNIRIIPEVENLAPSTGDTLNVLNLYGDFEPLTEYTLILRESLADRWGSQLGLARSLTFTTQPLPSNLVISQGSSFLYLTGGENAIPAQATNLYQVSVNIGSIPEDDYPLFIGSGLYDQLDEYYPADVAYWNQIVNIPGDDSYTVNLPLNQNGSALSPGLYRYQIYSQELPYNPPPYLLAVSDVHLTMKISPENMFIWAIDLSSGLPQAAAGITVYDESGEAIFQGTTNQDGVFQADFPEPRDLYEAFYYAVTGEPGEDSFGFTASNWSFGTEPYFFGLYSAIGAPQPLTYIYTDRPIYRPGQTVYYRLVQRDRADGRYALPEENSITVVLYKEGGESDEVELPLSPYGTAHGEFQLSDYARPGYYRLETESGMVLFQVAEYRKPEIDLEVTLKDAESKIGESWQGAANARYYFDAPAGGVDLSWTLRAEPAAFYLPGYQVGELSSNRFVYEENSYPMRWGSLISSGEAQTDSGGIWEAEGLLEQVDHYGREIRLPANYILGVTAQDETGFQVSGRSQTLVHPADFYIGVKPSAWIAVADQEVDFEILAVDWEKEPDGVHALKAEFNRVTWIHQTGEFGQIEYSRETELVGEQNFSTDRDGEASLSFTPTAPGTYQLDIYGGGARTEVALWVGGTGSAVWPTQSNQKLKLVADRDRYLPGEEAVVFIPNPFPAGAQALVTIERHRVIDYQTLTMTSSGEAIRIPLGDKEAPNVYVSVILLGQDPEGRADFRQGYLNLLVEPINQILQVEVVGEPARLGPGEEVEFTIRVTDSEGKPQQGEFSLAVVDQAVLALADPNSEDIGEAFYGVQPLSIRMGFPLGVHAGRQVFIAGGMGGGGDDVIGVREQFEDTGFWQADVVTDASGEAKLSFILPDNLTTWQADARGVTAGTEVGQGKAEIVTTKDLLIRPVTPRFLVAGDHLALAAVVHNNTGKDLSAEVSIQCPGIQLDLPGSSTQTVEIKAGSRTRVEWWGTVESIGEVNLLFLAKADGLQDAVKPYLGPLPVLRYIAPETFGTAGFLDSAGQRLEIISLPRTFDSGEGSLDIELSPSLAPVLLTALDALEDDPWFSTIEALSHFLPHVITYQTLQELELDYPQLEGNLGAVIPQALDSLAASQNEDGGWGWWSGGASDGEISSFILFGLVRAQQGGVFVDDLMIQQAEGYLLATLPGVDMLAESWQYEQLAFRHFALTEAGIDVGGGLSDLFEYSSRLSPAYQALLALALENQSPGGELSRSLLSNLAGSGVRTATGIHWENPADCRCWLNNTTTTTAMVTYALARSGEFQQLLPDAVRYLVSAAGPAGDWGSPYESGWSILALNEILKTSGDLSAGYEYSALVNGTQLIAGQAAGPEGLESALSSLAVSSLYPDDPNALVINRAEGNGTLYYKAHLTVFRPAADVQPYGKGLGLSRVYAFVDQSGKSEFTQSGEVGDLIQVILNLVVENDIHYLMVQDMLPAGVEVLDTRLNTSRQDAPAYQASDPYKNGWGWWYFNRPEVYDDRIVWGADYLPAGSYQLVYTISLTHPGEYQVLPARAWGQYFPEIQAISAGDRFVVKAD